MSGLPDLGVRHALLLQGPAGPFMRRFALELHQAGIEVTKVNFHGGDRHFFPDDTPFARVLSFTEPMDALPDFVRERFVRDGADGVFVFGGRRQHHRAATAVAESLGARVWVFEEGYLRPHWITLEEHGVNGDSRMPRVPQVFLDEAPPREPPSTEVGPTFRLAGWYHTQDAVAFTRHRRDFPHFVPHRSYDAYRHAAWWVRGAARKYWFQERERGLIDHFTGRLSGRFFFVPLQVHNDSQLEHSPFGRIEEFIDQVVDTFALHADPADHLLFKHHPMDRPFRDYTRLMARRARSSGLGDRLHYVHDLHLPTLLQNAKGTITINSTVGLQSAHHGTPTVTVGNAVYDLPGLTHQGDLQTFLSSPGSVDPELYGSFRRYLLRKNQANGSFHKRLPDVGTPTGVRWFRR